MKKVYILLVTCMILLSAIIVIAEEKPVSNEIDTTSSVIDKSNEIDHSNQIVIYYLHMNRRCMTCEKLEAYSKEAIDSGFAEQLKDSSIVFRAKNFEQEGNEHFAKDYKLFSQSLILSRQQDGKEIEWKNLDKIWELVGDKDQYITYVQTEVKNFINPKEAE